MIGRVGCNCQPVCHTGISALTQGRWGRGSGTGISALTQRCWGRGSGTGIFSTHTTPLGNRGSEATECGLHSLLVLQAKDYS